MLKVLLLLLLRAAFMHIAYISKRSVSVCIFPEDYIKLLFPFDLFSIIMKQNIDRFCFYSEKYKQNYTNGGKDVTETSRSPRKFQVNRSNSKSMETDGRLSVNVNYLFMFRTNFFNRENC